MHIHIEITETQSSTPVQIYSWKNTQKYSMHHDVIYRLIISLKRTSARGETSMAFINAVPSKKTNGLAN